MNLQDVTLNEISQSQKDLILHDSTYKNSSQTHKNRNGGCQGLDRGQNGELLFNGYKVSTLQVEKNPRDLLHNSVYTANWRFKNG